MEKTVYNQLRTRDAMVRQCKQYSIPTDWILDNGLISKVQHFAHSDNVAGAGTSLVYSALLLFKELLLSLVLEILQFFECMLLKF